MAYLVAPSGMDATVILPGWGKALSSRAATRCASANLLGEPAMRVKWEYCMLMQGESVGKRLGLGGGALVFRRFGLDGYVQNTRIGSGDNEELLGKTVALLGQNGWELVSVSAELQPGASFSGARWVFKRASGTGDIPATEPLPQSEAAMQDDLPVHDGPPAPGESMTGQDRGDSHTSED